MPGCHFQSRIRGNDMERLTFDLRNGRVLVIEKTQAGNAEATVFDSNEEVVDQVVVSAACLKVLLFDE